MNLVSGAMILVFCIVGALIAYGADNLGRHLGKTRKTLFKLRPRHTATLLTALAGFFTPLLTVILMASVSQDVRTILREGSNAAAERDRIKGEVEVKKAEVASQASRLTTLNADLDQRNKALAASNGRLRDSEGRRTLLQKTISGLESTERSLRGQSKVLQGQVSNFRKQVADARKNVQSLTQEYRNVQADYTLLTRNFRVVERDLQDRTEFQNRLIQESAALEANIKKLQDSEKQAQLLLQSTEKAYEQLKLEVAGQKATFDRELELARLDLDRLRGEISRLQTIGQNLRANADRARTRPMIFVIGEEMSRVRVPARTPAATASALLSSAFRSARLLASDRGADDSSGASAGLTETRQNDELVSIAQQEVNLVKATSDQRTDTVVVVSSLWNSFAGEFVPLKVRVLPNPVVFRAGEIIYEQRIDGARPDAEIVLALERFFQSGLRTVAQRKGMIPADGRENSFGTISREQILDLVTQIRSTGRVIRLQAVASKDIQAADTLALEYRLR